MEIDLRSVVKGVAEVVPAVEAVAVEAAKAAVKPEVFLLLLVM